MATIVLVHGAYQGGWCWKKVVDLLSAEHLSVITPTLTGLGERSHLLSSRVNLSTHITDIVNVLKYEELHDVILVGHSYAGMVISGAAEVVPDKIKHLVYLDAILPVDGETMIDIQPSIKSRAGEIIVSGEKVVVLVPPALGVFGVDRPEDVAWMQPLLTPHPYASYTEPIKITNPKVSCIRKTYLLSEIQASQESRHAHELAFERAQGGLWSREKIPGPHAAMVTHPKELSKKILELAQDNL